MGLLAIMSFLSLILVVGLYIASQGGHMPNKFELRLLDLIEQHSNGKNEVSEHPRITSFLKSMMQSQSRTSFSHTKKL